MKEKILFRDLCLTQLENAHKCVCFLSRYKVRGDGEKISVS